MNVFFLLFAALPPIPCNGDITSDLLSAIHGCYDDNTQCVIAIGPGSCHVSETIELCPTVEISGESEQLTTLHFPGGTTAFHVLPYEHCEITGRPRVGRVRIEKMWIDGANTTTVSFGILANNHVRLNRLEISDFTQGINLSADVNSELEGNANMFRMEEVYIYRTWHSGMVIDGGDVNAGLLSQVSIQSQACLNPTPFLDELGPCYGILDDGFLGNVYVASHIADVKGGNTPHMLSNGNARHALVGAYMETNQPPGYLSPTSLAIGGLALWQGPGTWIQGQNSNGLRFINDIDPNNVVRLELGEVGNTPGTFLALRADGINAGWPIRIKSDPEKDQYFLDIADLGINKSFARVVGTSGSTYTLGTLLLRSSLLGVE